MAVSRTTAWVDSTGAVDYAGAAILKSVRVTLNPAATAGTFLALYNGTTATPGVTTPVAVLGIDLPLTSGNKTRSFPLPGGQRFSTGICSFMATTFNGATAATTDAPLAVDVHYVPGN
jgi:hypothetical protein